MSDETPAPRSSILYAIGRLTAESEAHRSALAAIPTQVAAIIQPQLLAITTTQALHGRDIRQLQQRQYIWIGGGTVVIAVVGYLLPLILKGLPAHG